MDLKERRDHVDRLDLMDPMGQEDSQGPRDLLDHLVILLRESSIEERRTLTISRTLRRCVCVCVCTCAYSCRSEQRKEGERK